MRKFMLVLAAATMLTAVPAAAAEIFAEVNLAPLSRSFGMPSLGRRQGWLTISNRDWQQYSLVRNGRDLNLFMGGIAGFGEVITIPSGATVTIALEKETYRLRGSNGNRLNVRVREGRTTTLSLEPFGFVGSSGLRAVVNDGDRVRDEVLFDPMTVVMQPGPPPVIVHPPPPVIVTRPPVVVQRPRPPVVVNIGRPGSRPPPPSVRPGSGRPGSSRPGSGRPGSGRPGGNRQNHRDSGWGFSFNLGR